MSGTFCILAAILVALGSTAHGSVVMMRESYDAVRPPALPLGWESSQHRVAGQSDFFTTASSAHSAPNALQCTNATLEQWVSTSLVELPGVNPSAISFWTRRSGTFGAAVVVEYSLDGAGSAFAQFGDTLWPSGATGYVYHTLQVPLDESGRPAVRFRWRIVPAGTGSTGTFRIDDVEILGQGETALSWESLSPRSTSLVDGETCTLQAVLRNTGRKTIAGFSLAVIAAQDADSVERAPVEILATRFDNSLLPGDSTVVDIAFTAYAPGGTFDAFASFDGASGLGSDTISVFLPVSHRAGACIINEIMFSPQSGAPEWVEIVNTSANPISLSRWAISDADTGTVRHIPRAPTTILSAGFALLTDDSLGLTQAYGKIQCPIVQIPGFPTLNNDQDMIVLHDHTGKTIDSVAYDAVWHNPALVSISGHSLERISPTMPSNDRRNWTTSTAMEGATPGSQNSVRAISRPQGSGLHCAPNPFSPNGDGIDDVTLIQYSTSLEVATISAFVYDVRGRRIRRLADNDPGSSHGILLWDGRKDDGVRAAIGMYVVLLRATKADGGPIYEARCVVVLAMPL